jgi:hypothetical protein
MMNDTIAPPSPAASPKVVPPKGAAPSAAQLIDIGINLGHDSYDVDRDAVISRAEAAGVVQMLVNGHRSLARERPSNLPVRTRESCSPRPAFTRITRLN